VEPVYITESFFFDHEDFLAAPDQAYDVAVDSLTDNVAIVGARGFSGLEGSDLNDIDWYVRYLSPTGDLLWEHTIAGASLLDDRARSVAIDLSTQDVFVAGWVNNGTDNAAGADLDWVVTRYDDDGDGAGGPKVERTVTWESAPGASEGATAIALDEASDPLVAGWAIDELTNQEVWRVAKLTFYDGSPGQEWLGAPQGGNSRPAAIHFFTDPDVVKIAVAGTIDSGAGRDFAALVIEQDRDSDGTADSVDACPDDETKAADDGICGCGIPDFDKDGDGEPNCIDGCPTDPLKTDPGVCGCEVEDTDNDADGTPNCDEICDDDPDKTNPGECGCGAPDNDTDGDGILGCHDACANTPPGDEVDQFGCSLPPEPEDTGDEGSDSSSGGCGCASSPPSAAFGAPLLALVAAALGRRRRHTPPV
jgi:MYXO-CTERM domain-containing protein